MHHQQSPEMMKPCAETCRRGSESCARMPGQMAGAAR